MGFTLDEIVDKINRLPENEKQQDKRPKRASKENRGGGLQRK